MLDQRCLEFRTDPSGKVIGVKLGITKIPNSKYEIAFVGFRTEEESRGQSIAQCSVLNREGINTGTPARLSWPGQGPTFEQSLLPGNPNNQHIIVNGYNPPNMGPLAIHLGSKDAPESDIVYGLGLPYNRHVGYDIVFRERGVHVDPVIDDPSSDLESLRKEVRELQLWRDAVISFFGRTI